MKGLKVVFKCSCRLKSDVLKSSPEILSLISEHLFGQLEGFVNSEDSSINERWEVSYFLLSAFQKLLIIS